MHNYTLMERALFVPSSINFKKLQKEVTGKTILITGASSGIGKELAYLLSHTTAHLILVARREAAMNAMKTEIEKFSAKVTVYRTDLRNEVEVEELLAFLHQLEGGVDIVVSNAGISINRPIARSLERYHDFTRTRALNYFAPIQ